LELGVEAEHPDEGEAAQPLESGLEGDAPTPSFRLLRHDD
jgi:hypothetical protein